MAGATLTTIKTPRRAGVEVCKRLLILFFLVAAVANARPEIRPQPGPQERFLSSAADITVGGGGAGGGKTWGILYEPIRHIPNPNFRCVTFRREYPQITGPGGLWDKTWEMYPLKGGKAREGHLDWEFPSGSRVKFAHMQREEDCRSWDGSEVPLIQFDQLESFTWKQFNYMFSRNRSTCGVIPYIRATCNPNPDHFLRKFLGWWIDPATGFAIPERSGIIRYFVIIDDEVEWGGSPEELKKKFGADQMPKSATFIPSSVYDNQALLKSNPQYLANLNALPLVERERLLKGNWNIRYSAGMYFRKEWFKIVNTAPSGTLDVRYWDRAATPADKAKPTGSWTVGVKMRKCSDGRFYVLDVVRGQWSALEVERTIQNTASQDGGSVRVVVEQDPGQAGVAEAQYQIRNLAGFDVHANRVGVDKATRAKPLSAQVEAGNVLLVAAPWNEPYVRELQNFDGTKKCMADQVDASSGAFMALNSTKIAGAY